MTDEATIPAPQEHSVNELWRQQNRTQAEINHLREDNSTLKKGMENLERGFESLLIEVRRIAAPKATRWDWLISALILLGLVIGLYVQPLAEKARDTEQGLKAYMMQSLTDRVEIEKQLATANEWRRLMEPHLTPTERK